MTNLVRSRMLWSAVLLAVAAGTLPWWVSGYILGILTVAYYFSVFSMAWDLLFGFAGEVNFGPTFLIGLGAYWPRYSMRGGDCRFPYASSPEGSSR